MPEGGIGSKERESMVTGEMALMFMAPQSLSLDEVSQIADRHQEMDEVQLRYWLARFTHDAISFSRFWADCIDESVWLKTEAV